MSSRLMEPQAWAVEDTVTILAGADLLIRSINKCVNRKWPGEQSLRKQKVDIGSYSTSNNWDGMADEYLKPGEGFYIQNIHDIK